VVSFADPEETVEFGLRGKAETDLRAAALGDVGIHDDVARRLVVLVKFLTEQFNDAIAPARYAACDADAHL
jgi:hypothetical protein